MSAEADRPKLAPGLYLVATPIGNARDITLRALDILGSADVIAAEDTRNTRRLMDIHGVALGGRKLVSYNDHNGRERRPGLLARLADGASVACVSDAGTPLVADPGFALAREAAQAGHPVTTAPGASALLAALGVAGMPTDRFMFCGFLPPKSSARCSALAELRDVPATLVFFEAPRRVLASVSDMAKTFGEDRPASVCRELTKKFEETRQGALGGLSLKLATIEPRGEYVIVVGPPVPRADQTIDVEGLLASALTHSSLKDAVTDVAQTTGVPRKVVYRLALELKDRPG